MYLGEPGRAYTHGEHSVSEQRCTLAGVTLGWILDAMDIMLLALLGTEIGVSFGHAPGEWLPGFYLVIFGTQLVFSAMGGILFGYLGDRIGRKNALIIDLLMFAVSTTALMFVTDEYQFLGARMLTGIAIGGEWGLAAAILNEVWKPADRSLGSAILQSGWPMGVIIASSVAYGAGHSGLTVFGASFWWKAAFLVQYASIPIALFVWKAVPRSRHFESHRGKQDGTKMPVANPVLQLFSKKLWTFTLRAITLASVGFFAFYLVWTLVPNELVNEGFITGDQKFRFVAISGIAGIGGHWTFGALSQRVGRKRLFSVYAMVFAAATSLIVTATSDDNAILALICTVQFACGLFGSFGALFSELFPTSVRASGSGSTYNLGRAVSGGLQMSGLVGALGGILGLTSLDTAAFLASALMLLTGLLIWTFPETEKLTIEEIDSERAR